MNVQPYLFFNGRCEEALGFYRDALGAEVTALMRFRENPEPSHNPPGSEDKINGLVDVLRPYGILEMARTGVVAMARATSGDANRERSEPGRPPAARAKSEGALIEDTSAH